MFRDSGSEFGESCSRGLPTLSRRDIGITVCGSSLLVMVSVIVVAYQYAPVPAAGNGPRVSEPINPKP